MNKLESLTQSQLWETFTDNPPQPGNYGITDDDQYTHLLSAWGEYMLQKYGDGKSELEHNLDREKRERQQILRDLDYLENNNIPWK